MPYSRGNSRSRFSVWSLQHRVQLIRDIAVKHWDCLIINQTICTPFVERVGSRLMSCGALSCRPGLRTRSVSVHSVHLERVYWGFHGMDNGSVKLTRISHRIGTNISRACSRGEFGQPFMSSRTDHWSNEGNLLFLHTPT